MELLYKKFLLDKIQSNLGIFYQEPCVYYLNELGIEVSDFYEAYPILTSLDDSKYCGEGFREKGKYFIIDDQENMFWFVHYLDAFAFIGVEGGTMEKFFTYRGHKVNGYLLLTKEDILEKDIYEMIENNNGVFCETRNIGFNNVDEASLWLVNAGLASNLQVAKRQLDKHLKGITTSCYGMKFVKY